MAPPEVSRWWREWEHLWVEGGVLCHRVVDRMEDGPLWQVLVPRRVAHSVWQWCHQALDHLGANKAEASVGR